jgi:peptide chain release factor 2
VGESREERSQLQNKKTAFKRMANSHKFLLWLQLQLGHLAVLDDKVSRNLSSEVKIEVKRSGRWTEVPLSELQN